MKSDRRDFDKEDVFWDENPMRVKTAAGLE
jgi:hypothetical protein